MTDFLDVNGHAVPVQDSSGFKRQQHLAPGILRAIDGTAHQHANARKVAVTGAIPITEPLEGAALAGLLSARGHVWHFNEAASGDPDKYSARGLFPSGTPVAYGRRSGAEGDGRASTDSYDGSVNVAVPKLGDMCAHLGIAVTNALAANVADASSAAGFTARGAGSAVAYSTAKAWRGAGSVEVTVDTNTARGASCGYTTASASTLYTGSVYILAKSGTPQVDVFMEDVTLTPATITGTKVRVTLSTTVWRRVECAITTDATGGNHNVKLIVETAGVTGDDFYIDELMLVGTASSTGPWVAGTETRTASNLLYRLGDLRNVDDFTVMLWARVGHLGGAVLFGSGRVLVGIGDSTTNCVRVLAQLGDDGVDTQVDGVAGAHGDFAGFLDDYNEAWTHVAVVVRRNSPSGAVITTYTNGANEAEVLTGSIPVFTAPMLSVGSDLAGANIFDGMVDELVFVPWAMSEAMIASFYAREFSDLPRLLVSGQHLAGTAVELEMLSDQEALEDGYVQAAESDGTWSAEHRAISFKLVER